MRQSKLIKYIIDNNMHNEEFTGKVLWWSKREGHGIMVTSDVNHEVYFDSSVLKDKGYTPKSGDLLEFQFNTSVLDCACGKNVTKID